MLNLPELNAIKKQGGSAFDVPSQRWKWDWASGVRKQRSLRGGHDGIFLFQADLGREVIPVDLATGFV